MKKLNANELKVLKGIVKAAELNGYDFALTEDIKVRGITGKSLSGYMTDLHKKGFVTIHGAMFVNQTFASKGDRYVQITIDHDGFEAVGMPRDTHQQEMCKETGCYKDLGHEGAHGA